MKAGRNEGSPASPAWEISTAERKALKKEEGDGICRASFLCLEEVGGGLWNLPPARVKRGRDLCLQTFCSGMR